MQRCNYNNFIKKLATKILFPYFCSLLSGIEIALKEIIPNSSSRGAKYL